MGHGVGRSRQKAHHVFGGGAKQLDQCRFVVDHADDELDAGGGG